MHTFFIRNYTIIKKVKNHKITQYSGDMLKKLSSDNSQLVLFSFFFKEKKKGIIKITKISENLQS